MLLSSSWESCDFAFFSLSLSFLRTAWCSLGGAPACILFYFFLICSSLLCYDGGLLAPCLGEESGGTSESQNGHLWALPGTAKQLSKVVLLTYTPTSSEGDLHPGHRLVSTWCCQLFNFSQARGWDMASHFSFTLHIPSC